jgi:hypothetical protein
MTRGQTAEQGAAMSFARRAVLIAALITITLLLLLLWPIAMALRDALASSIAAHGQLITTTLLVVGLLLLVGLIRIVFAYGRRLDAQSMAAAPGPMGLSTFGYGLLLTTMAVGACSDRYSASLCNTGSAAERPWPWT